MAKTYKIMYLISLYNPYLVDSVTFLRNHAPSNLLWWELGGGGGGHVAIFPYLNFSVVIFKLPLKENIQRQSVLCWEVTNMQIKLAT